MARRAHQGMKVVGQERSRQPTPRLSPVPGDLGPDPVESQRIRSLLLRPPPGHTTRAGLRRRARRLASVLMVIYVPLAQANTSVEPHRRAPCPPPRDQLADHRPLVRRLIVVIVALVLIGLLVPRLAAVRQIAWPEWPHGRLPPARRAAGPGRRAAARSRTLGVQPALPIVQLAIATAVALAGLPYLSRPLHRIVIGAISLAALCAVVGAYGLPSASLRRSSSVGAPLPPATSPWARQTDSLQQGR